ncbi:MAG: hypothetical protein R2939_12665 [Kofleriaceae bacterium]
MIFRHVILPLVRSGHRDHCAVLVHDRVNEFIMASTFMTDERSYTLPVMVYNLGEFSDWGGSPPAPSSPACR